MDVCSVSETSAKVESIIEIILDVWRETDKYSQFMISGKSMRPIINNDDIVVIKHSSDGVGIGTIILYKNEQKLIAHRIVQRKKKDSSILYVSKGDSSRCFDPIIKQEQIIGKVVAIKKNKSTIYLNNNFWWLIGILIAIYSYYSGIFYILIRKTLRYYLGVRGK
jgi:signal peptidase I, archaeal type